MADKNLKQIKNFFPEAYIVPEDIKKGLGIEAFGSDGLFCHMQNKFSYVYRASEIPSLGDFLRNLREKDLHADIQFPADRKGTYDTMLAVYARADHILKAYEKLMMQDEILSVISQKSGCRLERLNLDQRLDNIRKVYATAYPDEYSTIEGHLENLREWSLDIYPERKYVFPDKRMGYSCFKYQDKFYKICFVRNFGSKMADKFSFAELIDRKEVVGIKLAIRSVSDYAVSIDYRDTFLDFKAPIQRMQRKGKSLGSVLNTVKNKERDTKEFCLAGCMFLLCADSEKAVTDCYEGLREQFLQEEILIDFYYGCMKEMLHAFPAGVYPDMNPFRMIPALQFYSYWTLTADREQTGIYSNLLI